MNKLLYGVLKLIGLMTHTLQSLIFITMDSKVGSICIGFQNPDKTIAVFEVRIYKILDELNRERYPNK